MSEYRFFNRDLSWVTFNERVLMEAANPVTPLIERIKFLSIYSSNLDEFYRVRMPVIMALSKIHKKAPDNGERDMYQKISHRIQQQQETFGQILTQQLIPELRAGGCHLVYNEPIPPDIRPETTAYFFNVLAAYLELIFLSRQPSFFPENNKLYLAVSLARDKKTETVIVNIPSDLVPRFFTTEREGVRYLVFIDDIIREHLGAIFPDYDILSAYSMKITRDAELNLQDEYEGDIAEKIEKQLAKRDFGLATRMLHQPGLPLQLLLQLLQAFHLSGANIVPGGNYHNLKDLASIPAFKPEWSYPQRKPVLCLPEPGCSLFDTIGQNDLLLHTPYCSYDTVLRFFNEAAIDDTVQAIYTTLYRVASDSRIVRALISAAKNGKNVTVFVELKARFDEANNIRWAKSMKAAGVKIIYSIPNLKVHAKVALVKRKKDGRISHLGMLATGNLNETTARFYTDHILFTAEEPLLLELEQLFVFLSQRKKQQAVAGEIHFEHLLVATFNLRDRFIQLIDREIEAAQQGLPAAITIKLNNLEEEVLISKLYDASNVGVTVNLIVRGICRLIPGVPGMSGRIVVKRIVDRYLEHGRIYIFHNGGDEQVYMGSADWMNRNIYRRIEVCFPVRNALLKQELKDIISLQLRDNTAAVWLDEDLNNVGITETGEPMRSQDAIYDYCVQHSRNH